MGTGPQDGDLLTVWRSIHAPGWSVFPQSTQTMAAIRGLGTGVGAGAYHKLSA